MKKIKNIGAMIDMSRNAVMTVPSLKDFIRILKKFGYKTLMLYTEDTYEVEGEPYFGYMRGRYSIEEMSEIDSFCADIGIELIPGIQTLAHLNGFSKWDSVPFDIDDILLVDDERVYEFLENVFKTLKKCYTHSKYVHIGMDEAWKLGRGKHINKYGYEEASEIIKRHSKRVVDLAEKYGFSPIMWADMFIRSWNDNNYWIAKTEIPKEYIDAVPSGVELGCWNYNSTNESFFDDMFYNHKQLSNKIWFAGGCWGWSGVAPHNKYSLKTMIPAINSCKKYGVENILMSLWGDDGAECSHYAQLPALCYLAEYAKGNTDEEKIKSKFKRVVGMEFDDFMKLDLPNEICSSVGVKNPSKYMLYSDPFNGFLDYTVSEGVGAKYAFYVKELSALAKKSMKWSFLFSTEAALCDVLSVKYELGVKTRRAYQTGDKAELLRLADCDYKEFLRKLGVFHKLFYKYWHRDNEGSGFDVQDYRLGGIRARAESCRKRLIEYVKGNIGRIKELECEILPFGGGEPGEPTRVNQFSMYSTANIISHS